jgi:hypothetical protein
MTTELNLIRHENYDRLWKVTIFDKLSNAHAKYFSPIEDLAVSEIIVVFKGKTVFRRCIPKKQMVWGKSLQAVCF